MSRVPKRFGIFLLSIVAAIAAVSPTVIPASATQATPMQSTDSSFQPFWVQTFKPTTAWSSAQDDADAVGQLQMWRYLQVVQPGLGGRLAVIDPRTSTQMYVDADSVGPVGPPPNDYLEPAPPDDESMSLPARIIGRTEVYDRPEKQPYFAGDEVSTNTAVTVQGTVSDGDWYRIGDDQYVPHGNVRLPSPPDRTFQGRWVDANLTEPVMVTAYEDDKPIYSALAVKGTTAYQTPRGVYRILRRVANETMDSATIGIPRTAPNGYYLKDVLFTQYFSGDGAALHYNYWRSDWGYAGSHGCLGMNYDDSEFFWDFGTVGTIVYVHG